MAYCLAKPRLALIQSRPPDWHFFSTSQRTLPRLFASAHVRVANTLTLLIKASAMVTVYRGHCRTLFFLPRINSLFIMCIGIIGNFLLVGRCARAESNPGHWMCHALLHMAPKCFYHWATWAGDSHSLLHIPCCCLLHWNNGAYCIFRL